MAINFTLNINMPKEVSYQKFGNGVLLPLLESEAPDNPIDGPVRLVVIWGYKNAKELNLFGVPTHVISWFMKTFMLDAGFWHNNMQVYDERIIRKYSNNPGITVSVQYGEDLEGDETF